MMKKLKELERGEHLVCCHECDELSYISDPEKSGRFECPNCGHLLLRHRTGLVEKMYALSLAALILLLVTNYFPFLSFHVAGNTSHTNFFTSAIYLFEDQQFLLAIAVLMTTIIVPLIRIVLILALFAPLYYGHLPRYAPFVLRALYHSLPWGMIDVLLVGVFVSMVKLVKMGTVIPGISLWSFMALVFVIAAMQVVYNPHPIWERIDEARRRGVAV